MVWCRGMVGCWGWVVGWGIVGKGNSGQSTGNSVLEHSEGCWEEEGTWEGWDVEAQSCLSALMSHKCVATVYILRFSSPSAAVLVKWCYLVPKKGVNLRKTF